MRFHDRHAWRPPPPGDPPPPGEHPNIAYPPGEPPTVTGMTVEEAITTLQCRPVKQPHWHIPIIYLTEFVLDSGWTWDELAEELHTTAEHLQWQYKYFGGERWPHIRPSDLPPPHS
jgi:hypothetical protein